MATEIFKIKLYKSTPSKKNTEAIIWLATHQAPVLASTNFALFKITNPLYFSLPIKETLQVFGNLSKLVERPLNRRFSPPNSS